MATNLVQEGSDIEFTAAANLSSSAVVVIGEQVGIVLNDVVSGAVGLAAMKGVFSVPKVSAAVIAAGESVIWDSSASAFDDNAALPAVGDVSNACTAWETKGAGDLFINVKLNTGKGTVT